MTGPVQTDQRIQFLDVLRGFAITGVLIAYVFWNLGTAPESTFTLVDKILDPVLVFLVDSKCFTLLANLFAIGFVLHMNKPDKEASLKTYRRRLAGLMIIGAFHALVLRNGDILLPYALLTWGLSFFYFASNKSIVIGMIIIFFIHVLAADIYHWMGLSIPKRPTGNENYWLDNFDWILYWYESAPIFWEMTLFYLLSGLLLGRFFITNNRRLTNKQLISITICGFLLSTICYLIINFYSSWIKSLPDIGKTFILRKTIGNLLMLIHRGGMAAAYACLFYLLSKHFSLKYLAVLGRTSLSNYILQAIIVVPVCLAFDLFDNITPTLALILTIIIWVFQVIWSTWWLKHYSFGPLEWLLRRFTYGKSLLPKPKLETELVPTAEIVKRT